ncbi:AAA family ATPase [Paenibacillus xylanilyticus]|uniref:AAA family ATPase n=1 Tax=Paenibacillus xylanilyticus TaxID=248903 RepID=UPI0039A33D59
MIYKKIHIIGSTGSGKTYLARNLSNQMNIPYFELDKVMWSSSVEFAGKNPPEIRDRLLEDIIAEDQWIIEGIYYKWLMRSFEEADMIIFLTPKPMERAIRIVMRFIKQRIGLEKANYKQTLKGLIDMLKWNHKFDRENKKKIHEILEQYKRKLLIVNSNKEVLSMKIFEEE